MTIGNMYISTALGQEAAQKELNQTLEAGRAFVGDLRNYRENAEAQGHTLPEQLIIDHDRRENRKVIISAAFLAPAILGLASWYLIGSHQVQRLENAFKEVMQSVTAHLPNHHAYRPDAPCKVTTDKTCDHP